MVDISTAFTAIKETLGLLKVVNDAKSDYEIKAATSEIQTKLITLQNECFSLGNMVRSHEAQVIALKTKIAEFENFERDAEGYILNQLESGTFVYSKKQIVNETEVSVHLYPNCFTKKIISIVKRLNFDYIINIANRLKNDYSRCPDMWQRSIADCYQNNVAWLYTSTCREDIFYVSLLLLQKSLPNGK